ncbi:MAG: glycosyltransferase family 4 protein [Bryobacteraceae bacterium]
MRILLVSDYGTPTGGAELMLLALREALRLRGHDARLFASSARPLGAENLADYQCLGFDSAARGLIQIANPSALLGLRRVIREFRPDLVHVRLHLSQLSPLILPLLEDVPAIYHAAWYRSICPIGTKMWPEGDSCTERAGFACLRHRCFPAWAWPSTMLQLKLWRHWRRVFNVVVANSHSTARLLDDGGISPVEVIWNGVPRSPARPPLSGRPTVVFAGRLVPEKGADVLIRAFATVRSHLPAAELVIAGDGEQRNRLQRLIDELSLSSSVRLMGHLNRSRIEACFAAAWVQAVPSRWREPFGIVAAEAMMRGTAVIATGSGGLNEIVQDGRTGILTPPNDANALAAALLRLLSNRDLAESLGACGREFALHNLTEDVFVDRFVALYERLLTGCLL